MAGKLLGRLRFLFHRSGSSLLVKIPVLPPPRSIVLRAATWGVGGQGSIPDHVTPKT